METATAKGSAEHAAQEVATRQVSADEQAAGQAGNVAAK